MGFRVMPSIHYSKEGHTNDGSINEPITRTFENLLIRDGEIEESIVFLYDMFAWLLVELDKSRLVGNGTGLLGISPGVPLAIENSQFVGDGLSVVGDQIIAVSGSAYLFIANLQVQFGNQNDTAIFGWFDVTNGVQVGTSVEHLGRQVSGNNAATALTAGLPVDTTYELRMISGDNPTGVSWTLDVVGSAPFDNVPPTVPPSAPLASSKVISSKIQSLIANKLVSETFLGQL